MKILVLPALVLPLLASGTNLTVMHGPLLQTTLHVQGHGGLTAPGMARYVNVGG